MKKSFFLLLVTIVLVASGCGEINPPEPPVVQKFTVVGNAGPNGFVTPSIAIVEKGGSATFTIKADPGYLIESLKDNGNILPPIDVYTVRDVIGDDTFEVSFKKDSLLWPLLKKVWKQNGYFSFANGEWIHWDDPYPSVVNFASDGTVSTVWNGNTYIEKWSLDKSKNPAILVYGGNYYTIAELTEKSMKIYYTNSQGIIFLLTYYAE